MSDANRHVRLRSLHDHDERWTQFRIGGQQLLNAIDGRQWSDVSGTQVDDSHELHPTWNRQSSEIGIVSQYDSTFGLGELENCGVASTGQTRLFDIDDVESFGSQGCVHVRMDILIGEDGELAELHGAPAVRYKSFFKVPAAKSTA